MTRIRTFLAAALCGLLSTGAALAEAPVLKVAVLKIGTVNWELDSIRHNGDDTANGFALEVQGMAGGSASQIAFQGGEADAMVTDWLWVARQRAAGKDYVFIPYSRAVGGLLVRQDSPAQSLSDMQGKAIGIAGGPLDKSWLILQAYAAQEYGLDLKTGTEQVFGAPPLIFKSALSGEVDGALNYWHFNAKMQAAGMRTLIDVADAARALGLDPDTPLLGYVVKGEFLRDNPDLVQGFAAASRAAKMRLAEDDAEWDRLRPIMNVKNDAQFEALKAGFRAGIPAPGPIDEAAAARMLALMAKLGGPELVGTPDTLPEGVFLNTGG